MAQVKFLLERIVNKKRSNGSGYVIGHLYDVTGGKKEFVCDTIEDQDRGLSQELSVDDNKRLKKKSITCIPVGTYRVTTKIVSGTFSKKQYYKSYPCLGRVPRLLNVPAFDGILMHRGSDENSSAGCIILGYNKVVGKVVESQRAYEKVAKLLGYGTDGHQITIVRKYTV